MDVVKRFPLEAITWAVGLILLSFLDPHASHFSLCPLKNLGFDFCPGCGLGKSIAYLLDGEIRKSFSTHPLGIFAFVILSLRIFQLTKNHYILYTLWQK